MGRITSTERGANVTMCACINAIKNAQPPAFIFSRVKFNEERMTHQAPAGSQGFSNSSGWMNNAIFPKVLQHFLCSMNVLKANGLLIFDNLSKLLISRSYYACRRKSFRPRVGRLRSAGHICPTTTFCAARERLKKITFSLFSLSVVVIC